MNFKFGIIIPIIVLSLIFILFTFSLFNYKYQEQQSLVNIEKNIIVATKISTVLYEIEKENGLNIEFIDKKEEIVKAIDNYISDKVILNIQTEANTIDKDFQYIILLNLLSFILFISMLLIISKLLKDGKKLQSLTDRYVITSTTNLHGIITSASEAFCKISGYSKYELIGKEHNIVRDPTEKKAVFEEMWKTLKNDEIWYGDVRNKHKNGSFYWVYAIISPMFNSKGKKIGYSAIRQNITDKKKILELNTSLKDKISFEVQKNREKDQQLIEQSRLAQMGKMISMIAHQWRQPLNAISFNSSGLELKAQLGTIDTDTVLKLSQQISANTQHLSQTIDDFRNFFKSEKIKVKISLNQIIKSVLNIIASSIDAKKIKIIQELNTNDSFYTYPNELQQVILNILQNAEDILTEKKIEDSYIKITTYQENSDYILKIKDNGGGISDNIMNEIFNPYFSTKLEKDGTGLGLYMSKIIVEEHCSGKISIENDTDGAVFTIKLHSLNNETEVC